MIIKSYLSIIIITYSATLGLSAQEVCGDKIIGYKEWSSFRYPEWELNLYDSVSSGRLHYFGVYHTFDPDEYQYNKLESYWDKISPTIAFYEGTGSGFEENLSKSIEKSGEPGLVRFLASESGIEAKSLEPSKEEEISHLQTQFSQDQIILFFILRSIAHLRERNGMNETALRKRTVDAIEYYNGFEKLNGKIKDLESLEEKVREYWPRNTNWWEYPLNWFSPTATSDETGSVFTNKVNRSSSEFRDYYMYQQLVKAVKNGHIVFAVVGRNHVAMQANALRCAIE